MGSLKRRLEQLEAQVAPEPPRSPEPRARMRAALDEIAAAKREGRPLSPEAQAAVAALERRLAREHS